MKRIQISLLCLSIIILTAFIGDKKENKGGFVVEGKSYTATYFYYHPPRADSPYFSGIGRINKSSPYYGDYSYHINIKTLPATGTYLLKDFSKEGEAGLLITTPGPNSKAFRAQSGVLEIVNKGSEITASFSNVPVKSDIGGIFSSASGSMTISLK